MTTAGQEHSIDIAALDREVAAVCAAADRGDVTMIVKRYSDGPDGEPGVWLWLEKFARGIDAAPGVAGPFLADLVAVADRHNAGINCVVEDYAACGTLLDYYDRFGLTVCACPDYDEEGVDPGTGALHYKLARYPRSEPADNPDAGDTTPRPGP